MAAKSSSVRQAAWIAYVVLLHIALAFFVIAFVRDRIRAKVEQIGSARTPEILPIPSSPAPSAAEPARSGTMNSNEPPAVDPAGASLVIPVVGVKPEGLIDTFSVARGTYRTHDAIDIAAPKGTPVVAAVTGTIVKFFDSVPGGITIYQASEDGHFMYYYGHLERRADGLQEGQKVSQGTVIGYVGDTGNAGAGNYHLHFSIAKVADPKRYWEGTYINPFPYLKAGKAPSP